jgi:hypothetical protein
MPQISLHILVICDPPFFLTVLSQSLEHGGQRVSALLLFPCVVKLVLLNLILS